MTIQKIYSEKEFKHKNQRQSCLKMEKEKKGENRDGERKVEKRNKGNKIKEIKYLGYIIQKNGETEKYMIERFKRTMVAMKKTQNIERLFRDDNIEDRKHKKR